MKYFLPKISHILFIAILTSIVLMGPQTFNLDGDLGRHITIGNYILDRFTIPTKDIFSHTMYGEALTPHEWIAQLIFAAAHRILSLGGDVLVIALLIAGTFALIYRDSVQRSGMPLISLTLSILAAAASSLHWLARPHVFTFLLLTVWTYLLEKLRRHQNFPIWYFPILMLIWANTHGAFISGFVVLGAYIFGYLIDSLYEKKFDPKKITHWLMVSGASFSITFLNPSGYHLWQTSLGYIKNSYLVNHTVEYQSIDFHTSSALPFLFFIFLSILILGFKYQRTAATHTILIAGWTIMGLYSARNIPLYAIIAAPILSEAIAVNFTNKRWQSTEKNFLTIENSAKGNAVVLISIICVFFLLNTTVMRRYNTYNPSSFPVDAINWLDKNPQKGNVFNSFVWGGYLLYRDWPSRLVFIDGQTDFYGELLTREYEAVIFLDEGWKNIFEKYDISWVLIETDSPLAKKLEAERWIILYKDNTAMIIKK